MTEDHVFPEDQGTGAPDGDNADAANFGALADHPNLRDYKVSGLEVTPDYGVPDFDLSDGKAFISDTAATAKTSGENRDQGVLYEVEVSARSGISLADNDVNYVYLDVDLSTDDNVSIVVNQSDSSPSNTSLKIAEVDTSNDTKTEINQNPESVLEFLILTTSLQNATYQTLSDVPSLNEGEQVYVFDEKSLYIEDGS